MQNYKVFIKNTLLIFTDISFLDENATIYYDYQLNSFEDDFYKFIESFEGSIFIKCEKDSPFHVMTHFFRSFKKIDAAGGWVIKNAQVLFIYRNGFWDLPKGKVEKGETIAEAALREVEEECGLTNLVLKDKIIETYHCYEMKGRWVFKTNHWYLMHYHGDETLIPQTEEGITEVKWFNGNEVPLLYAQTYASLVDLMDVGLKLIS